MKAILRLLAQPAAVYIDSPAPLVAAARAHRWRSGPGARLLGALAAVVLAACGDGAALDDGADAGSDPCGLTPPNTSGTGVSSCGGVSCLAGQYCALGPACAPGCLDEHNCQRGGACDLSSPLLDDAGNLVGACVLPSAGGACGGGGDDGGGAGRDGGSGPDLGHPLTCADVTGRYSIVLDKVRSTAACASNLKATSCIVGQAGCALTFTCTPQALFQSVRLTLKGTATATISYAGKTMNCTLAFSPTAAPRRFSWQCKATINKATVACEGTGLQG